MDDTPRYWFKAKRYGWGWGMPSTWEGWLVVGAFLAGTFLVAAWVGGAAGAVLTVLLACALVAVAWAKGESPRWRWGGRA